jgi:hypothetical protein
VLITKWKKKILYSCPINKMHLPSPNSYYSQCQCVHSAELLYHSMSPSLWSVMRPSSHWVIVCVPLSGDQRCSEGGQPDSGPHALETPGQGGLGTELQHRPGAGEWPPERGAMQIVYMIHWRRWLPTGVPWGNARCTAMNLWDSLHNPDGLLI